MKNPRKVTIQVEIGLRDYASFEDLALQEGIQFSIVSLELDEQDAAKTKPRRTIPAARGLKRKKPVPVTAKIVRTVKQLGKQNPNATGVWIQAQLPEDIRVSVNPIRKILRGDYDHLLEK